MNEGLELEKKIRAAQAGDMDMLCELIDMYMALIDISVRQNNKKLKFWYGKEQLEQIKNLVNSASENAELKFETRGNKLVSFKVVDTLNHHVMFTGLFV